MARQSLSDAGHIVCNSVRAHDETAAVAFFSEPDILDVFMMTLGRGESEGNWY